MEGGLESWISIADLESSANSCTQQTEVYAAQCTQHNARWGIHYRLHTILYPLHSTLVHTQCCHILPQARFFQNAGIMRVYLKVYLKCGSEVYKMRTYRVAYPSCHPLKKQSPRHGVNKKTESKNSPHAWDSVFLGVARRIGHPVWMLKCGFYVGMPNIPLKIKYFL